MGVGEQGETEREAAAPAECMASSGCYPLFGVKDSHSWRCEEGSSLAVQVGWLECVGTVGVSLARAFMWLQEAGVTDPVRLECGSVACLGPT